LLVLLLLLLAAAARTQEEPVQASPGSDLVVRMGLTADGRPTPEWIDMIGVLNDEDSLSSIAMSRNPLTVAQQAWLALIEDRAQIWPALMPNLKIPFGNVTPPPVVAIVMGNIGGSDAFVPDDKTIGIDLERLEHVYGSALKPQNTGRIDRFFAHEYTHLLHKAWRSERKLVLRSPLETALWICLTEGLGNYRSLSSRWATSDGQLTPHASEVLDRLQPVFVERLSALEHATGEEAGKLMEGLSMGPFEQKWGALTMALWLAQDIGGDDYRLRKWVDLGPWGVLELAQMYLPEELAGKMPGRGR